LRALLNLRAPKSCRARGAFIKKAKSEVQSSAMTRFMKTQWIVVVVVVVTASAACAAYAMELPRMALWQVVRACVTDYKLTGAPFPCLEVNLAGGEEKGHVVVRAPLLNDTVLAPTRRTIGIEDPFLLSPEAPNYFDAAWRARAFLKDASGQVPERDAIALFVNSAIVRTQDQLHIHVGCLLPYARRTLAAVAPKVPMGEWAQIGPVVPHTMFWAYRIPGTDLGKVNPFRLAAEELGPKAAGPGDLTVVVVGARVDNDDQFLILASYAKAPHAWWPVGAGNVLESCSRVEPRSAG
jgi:CDP-diacylglycerol pyrophosphatase